MGILRRDHKPLAVASGPKEPASIEQFINVFAPLKPTGRVAEICPGALLCRWAGLEQRTFRPKLSETSEKAAGWKASIHYFRYLCIYAGCCRLDDELLSGHGTIMFTLNQRLTSLSRH